MGFAEDRLFEKETVVNIDDHTTIRWCEEPDSEATIWTASRSWQTRLQRLGLIPTRIDKRGDSESHWYTCPKSWVAIRQPRRVVMTDSKREQLASMRARSPKGKRTDTPFLEKSRLCSGKLDTYLPQNEQRAR